MIKPGGMSLFYLRLGSKIGNKKYFLTLILYLLQWCDVICGKTTY